MAQNFLIPVSNVDNPIIDPNGTFPHNLYHAGNFMALSPAEAMDKVRHVMLGIGTSLHSP
jgi:phenylalanine ammonia-lyase